MKKFLFYLKKSGLQNEKTSPFPKGSNQSSLNSLPKSDLQAGYLTSLRLFSRENDLKRWMRGERFLLNEYEKKNKRFENNGNHRMALKNSKNALNLKEDRACFIKSERPSSIDNEKNPEKEERLGFDLHVNNDRSIKKKKDIIGE